MAVAIPGLFAEGSRVIKLRVAPAFPEIARRMNISGSVKLQIVIGPDGSVKSVKPLGGHPLLIDSAVQAVKAWKYEKAAADTTDVVTINFSQPD